MAENKEPDKNEPETKVNVKVVVDRSGTVELSGLESREEFTKIAERLGMKNAVPLMRLENAAPQDMDHVVGRSRILGYELEVRDPAADGSDAPAARFSAPPRRMGVGSVVGFVTIPALVLALGAVLTGLGTGIRDQLLHEYSPVASLRTVESLVEQAPPAPKWYEKLLNPDDTRYVSLPVQDALLMNDKEAIWDGHLVTIPDLKAPSIEALASGGTLIFHLDTRKSEPDRLFVEEILRDGTPTGEVKLWMNLKPIATGQPPVAQYGDGSGILFDNKDTFEGVSRFRTGGYLEKTTDGYRITGSAFRVALAPGMTPELEHFLEPFVRPAGTEFADEGAPPPPLMFYLDLEEIFPWSSDGSPDRRQTEQEIGMARLDGVQFGDLYLANRPG